MAYESVGAGAVLSPSWRLDVHRSGETAVVSVGGDLDAASSRLLRECVSALVAEGVRDVRLRTARLSFVDAAGVGALIGAARRLREAGGSLSIEGPSRQVARLLDVTGAARVLAVLPGGAEA